MARQQYKIHYIYKTTCKVTGKFYIGMHSTFNEDDGYIGSGKRLWYSIRKHGKENHVKEIVEYCLDRSSLKVREKEIVNEELLNDKMCMNLQIGGGGGFSIEQQKINSKKGYEKKQWLRNNDPAWVIKNSIAHSNGNIKAYKNGRAITTPDWTGRKHSEETKELLKGHTRQTGEKNSQFGTCWIHNHLLKKSIRIKKDNLNDYLKEGWNIGMKRIYLVKHTPL